jgi:predicted MPP superfamily phosphohydrolase
MVSILQISDLHRDPENPIRNDALLTSLENARSRYTRKGDPIIPPPDIIVVSGDIIQGVRPGTLDPDVKLAAQNREALDFLIQLTDRVVGGDRRRVVIVPGNHDVSACHFMESVERVDIAPKRKKELVTQLFSPDSIFRWSWAEFELYRISDQKKYAGRLGPFAGFYEQFYQGKRKYSLEPSEQFDIFDYPEFNVTIVAFSSCFNNDILNRPGAIHPGCIAEASRRLRARQFDERFLVAVWHHNTEGLPMQTDYMDPGVLQNLIDNGFSLGLHGHQHRPQFLDTRFRYGGDRRITVISAGTLCGSAAFRFGRAYNIVELDTERRTGRLHLREMQNDDLRLPIWGCRALPPNTANYLSFVPDSMINATDTSTFTATDITTVLSNAYVTEFRGWRVSIRLHMKTKRPLGISDVVLSLSIRAWVSCMLTKSESTESCASTRERTPRSSVFTNALILQLNLASIPSRIDDRGQIKKGPAWRRLADGGPVQGPYPLHYGDLL